MRERRLQYSYSGASDRMAKYPLSGKELYKYSKSPGRREEKGRFLEFYHRKELIGLN